jgi:hypothetical protein
MKKVGLVSLGCAKNRVELIAMPPGSDVALLKLEVSPDTALLTRIALSKVQTNADAEGNPL